MLRIISYLLVFLIGGAIGFFFGGTGGGAAGTLVGSCKMLNASVASGVMTQDQANATAKTVFDELVKETGASADSLKQQLPKILEQMKKESAGQETPCQTAISTL
jgi:polyhydroxyalkanoate synthesis regulator phasin